MAGEVSSIDPMLKNVRVEIHLLFSLGILLRGCSWIGVENRSVSLQALLQYHRPAPVVANLPVYALEMKVVCFLDTDIIVTAVRVSCLSGDVVEQHFHVRRYFACWANSRSTDVTLVELPEFRFGWSPRADSGAILLLVQSFGMVRVLVRDNVLPRVDPAL